ncbi:MAG: hypothetical protein IJ198_01125 [Lachnospiraceae bacterium]|nr:hypothetical protein [Lachnospiraceae bacterium]
MESIQIELRKHQHTLAVVGMGAMGFGIWSVAKAVLYLMIATPVKDIVLTGAGEDERIVLDLGMAIGTALAMALIDMGIRWKIGKRALQIAKGEAMPGAWFFGLSAVVGLVDLVELIIGLLGVMGILSVDSDGLDLISTLLMDLTSVITLIMMIVSAWMIKKLTRELTGKSTNNAD